MPGDSSDIDNALLAKLGADTELLTQMPNGAYYDEGPPGATRFVIVHLIDEVDGQSFDARAFEDALYQVTAVGRSTPAVPLAAGVMKAAAARLDALLDPQPPLPPATLSVPGYGLMTLHREARIRVTEVDAVDPTIRWEHRGGHYRLVMST